MKTRNWIVVAMIASITILPAAGSQDSSTEGESASFPCPSLGEIREPHGVGVGVVGQPAPWVGHTQLFAAVDGHEDENETHHFAFFVQSYQTLVFNVTSTEKTLVRLDVMEGKDHCRPNEDDLETVAGFISVQPERDTYYLVQIQATAPAGEYRLVGGVVPTNAPLCFPGELPGDPPNPFC